MATHSGMAPDSQLPAVLEKFFAARIAE